MERDVLMREIRMLAAALARAIVHRKAGRYVEALTEIDRSVAASSHVEVARLIEFAPGELKEYLTDNEELNVDFATSLANLLQERGNILVQQSGTIEANRCYNSALEVLRIIRSAPGAVVPLDLENRIQFFSGKVGNEDSK